MSSASLTPMRRLPLLYRSRACPRSGCISLKHRELVRPISYTAPARDQNALVTSPLGPVGVEAALLSQKDSSFKPKSTLFSKEFSLADRVAVVTGGQRGIGLEMASTLAEAGATVYCLDLPSKPDETFDATRSYLSKLGLPKGARLEYESIDVTKQKAVWDVVEKIAKKEGRMDVCVAAAGVIGSQPSLEYTAEEMDKIMKVNVNGVYYTAQAAARQMVNLGNPGSIVLIASVAGTIAFGKEHWSVYGTSKAAVKQMGRYLACELGPSGIRVNTISPGYIYSKMTRIYLDEHPELIKAWSAQVPLARIGTPADLRGAVAWLASDASAYCNGSDILVTGGMEIW